MKALLSNIDKFIKWPTGQRLAQLVHDSEFCGFPGAFGAIDGSHIRILAPGSNPDDYFNRKRYHSIVLQAVSAQNLQFLDIYAGWPGSVHDARILSNSPLYTKAEIENSDLFPSNTHILGDSAYTIKTWLLPPYKDYGNLTAEKTNFNKIHSSTRQCVENSFALVKGRFRQLRETVAMRVELVPRFVTACCVAHNICLQRTGEDLKVYMEEGRDGADSDPNCFTNVYPNNSDGKSKRDFIAQSLCN